MSETTHYGRWCRDRQLVLPRRVALLRNRHAHQHARRSAMSGAASPAVVVQPVARYVEHNNWQGSPYCARCLRPPWEHRPRGVVNSPAATAHNVDPGSPS